jgi:hypothetical protein
MIRHDPSVDQRVTTTSRTQGLLCHHGAKGSIPLLPATESMQNAWFFGRRKAGALTIPFCTFTDPEVAHVGLPAEDAERRRPDVQTISVPLSDVDRADLDDETEGFVKVRHERGRLLGCTIVAAHAGEMIGQATAALAHGTTLNDCSSAIYAYPTQAEALRKAGDAYRRTRLTAGVRRWLERYFRLTRW